MQPAKNSFFAQDLAGTGAMNLQIWRGCTGRKNEAMRTSAQSDIALADVSESLTIARLGVSQVAAADGGIPASEADKNVRPTD
jgi:hypothetical protein